MTHSPKSANLSKVLVVIHMHHMVFARTANTLGSPGSEDRMVMTNACRAMSIRLRQQHMKLKQIWLESIQKHSIVIQEWLLSEAPHTKMVGGIPHSLRFLDGAFVDFGFENLKLSQESKHRLLRAFSKDGVKVPDSRWKLRHVRPGITVVEELQLLDAGIVTLPDDWAEAVLVINNDDTLQWIGKQLRDDQIVKDSINWDDYIPMLHGYLRRSTNV